MSIEFPEDLLPLPGAITGTERILANKNTVTLDDVKEFVHLGFISAEPIELDFQPEEGFVDNVQWVNGSMVRVGPVVMLQGSVSFEFSPIDDSYEILIADYSQLNIPAPLSDQSLGNLGIAVRLSGINNPSSPAFLMGDGEISIVFDVIVPLNQGNKDKISFFISYLTNE